MQRGSHFAFKAFVTLLERELLRYQSLAPNHPLASNPVPFNVGLLPHSILSQQVAHVLHKKTLKTNNGGPGGLVFSTMHKYSNEITYIIWAVLHVQNLPSFFQSTFRLKEIFLCPQLFRAKPSWLKYSHTNPKSPPKFPWGYSTAVLLDVN